MLLIGITGCIGSGKTIVSKVFQTLGIPIYNSDKRAKDLMAQNPELIQKIKQHFGDDSYLENKELNRTYLAAKVFSDPEATKTINSIVHPVVGDDFKAWIKKQSSPYIIKEAALMIESGAYKSLDHLILVSAPEETRIERVLKRDSNRSRQDVLNIISKQMNEEDMKDYAHSIIVNDSDHMILNQILELDQKFRNLSN